MVLEPRFAHSSNMPQQWLRSRTYAQNVSATLVHCRFEGYSTFWGVCEDFTAKCSKNPGLPWCGKCVYGVLVKSSASAYDLTTMVAG